MKNWCVRIFLSMLLMQSKNKKQSGKQNITVWPLHSIVSIFMKTILCNLLQQKLKSIAKALDKTL